MDISLSRVVKNDRVISQCGYVPREEEEVKNLARVGVLSVTSDVHQAELAVNLSVVSYVRRSRIDFQFR